MPADKLTQESRIKVKLLGGKVDPFDLREAVEFFLYGPGVDMTRPCSRQEWQHLLLLTELRRPPLSSSDLEGEFLS